MPNDYNDIKNKFIKTYQFNLIYVLILIFYQGLFNIEPKLFMYAKNVKYDKIK